MKGQWIGGGEGRAVTMGSAPTKPMIHWWNTMDSAPRDGTNVLLFYPSLKRQVQLGFFVDSETFEYGKSAGKRQYWLALSLSHILDAPEPTYWMPVPVGPDGAAS